MRDRGRATGEAAGYRQKALETWDGRCERCGEEFDEGEVETHHVDRDRSNDNADNLEVLCRTCHLEEHNGDDPLWGVLVSMPRPVLEALDRAVEEGNMSSRSEAVSRAVADAYPADAADFQTPLESVGCWFSDDLHTDWVSDSVRPPDPEGDA